MSKRERVGCVGIVVRRHPSGSGAPTKNASLTSFTCGAFKSCDKQMRFSRHLLRSLRAPASGEEPSGNWSGVAKLVHTRRKYRTEANTSIAS